jgi:hypothetical protein
MVLITTAMVILIVKSQIAGSLPMCVAPVKAKHVEAFNAVTV